MRQVLDVKHIKKNVIYSDILTSHTLLRRLASKLHYFFDAFIVATQSQEKIYFIQKINTFNYVQRKI